eukprot:scaffold5312_cov118-Isochrysis_galbana.AAC.6
MAEDSRARPSETTGTSATASGNGTGGALPPAAAGGKLGGVNLSIGETPLPLSESTNRSGSPFAPAARRTSCSIESTCKVGLKRRKSSAEPCGPSSGAPLTREKGPDGASGCANNRVDRSSSDRTLISAGSSWPSGTAPKSTV